MNDTTSAAPSDAEIEAQWRESVSKHEKTAAFVRDFARAVLAKWGQPDCVTLHTVTPAQPVAEPAKADSVLEDAARYRWLRINAIGAFRTNDGKGPVSVYHLSKIPAIPGIPEETDAAIDAARAQAKQGE